MVAPGPPRTLARARRAGGPPRNFSLNLSQQRGAHYCASVPVYLARTQIFHEPYTRILMRTMDAKWCTFS